MSHHLNSDSSTLTIRRLQAAALFCLLFAMAAPRGYAQTFNSGSTGADGAFSPVTSQQIQLPESGVFNYTTVNIPGNVTITYKKNSRNTPVTILATGNVTINGTINVNGANGSAGSFLVGAPGGPGGFDGGRGGVSGASSDRTGVNGGGPGGGGGGTFTSGDIRGSGGGGGFAKPGAAGLALSGGTPGAGGATYGTARLIPLIGGSGGGGSATSTSFFGAGNGGGGGGAVLIASSGTITIGGAQVIAQGGNGNNFGGGTGGGGAGGAIRLVANTITGNGTLIVSGGGGASGTVGAGGSGFIRVEAFDFSGFNSTITPADANFSMATPNPAIPANLPQLQITSVAGINAPATPVGSFNGVSDITVPTAQVNPVTVALSAANIPTGGTVQVKVTPEYGAFTTVQSTALAGTTASSTATASVTLPAGVALISATTTIDLTLMSWLKPIFIDGERVRKMEVSAAYGGNSEITYITESGKRIRQTGE